MKRTTVTKRMLSTIGMIGVIAGSGCNRDFYDAAYAGATGFVKDSVKDALGELLPIAEVIESTKVEDE